MARYVDADKVIEHIRQYKNSNKKTFQQGINFAIKVVCRALSDNRIVPRADVQEVVKCQECKHCTKYELRGDVLPRIYRCGLSINACDEDFFCKYGERKDI